MAEPETAGIELSGPAQPGTGLPARLDEIDVVRGVALGGMLLVNLGVFSGAAQTPLLQQSGADRLAGLLAALLAEGKFYPLFAFLFGWGIARRQCLHGQNPPPDRAGNGEPFFFRNLRRMAVLAVIGLLHGVLLWQGDILFAYALLGMLLPLLRRVPSRLLAALAVPVLLLAVFLAVPGPGASLDAAYEGWISPALIHWLGLPGRNPWAAASPIHFHLVQFAWKMAYFPDWLGNFAALILGGYACGKAGGLKLPAPRTILLLALPLNLLYAFASQTPGMLPGAWAGLVGSLGGPLLGLGYALGIARCYQMRAGQRLLEPLRKIGRMPLTTYLSQSLIGALLFPWPRPGAFPPALVWPLAGGIFLAQLVFASLWLSRFRQGPVEWVWRRLGR